MRSEQVSRLATSHERRKSGVVIPGRVIFFSSGKRSRDGKRWLVRDRLTNTMSNTKTSANSITKHGRFLPQTWQQW